MALLLCASVVSWAIILRKRRALARTRAAAESFEDTVVRELKANERVGIHAEAVILGCTARQATCG